MEDRKYRQSGYKEHPDQPQAGREASYASRAPGTVNSRTVCRCADCATPLPTVADSFGQCPKCRSELHSCGQCAHFDPDHRFECTQAILERIPDKRARNECVFFSLRVTVERDTSSGSVRPEEARRAFDRLFKN